MLAPLRVRECTKIPAHLGFGPCARLCAAIPCLLFGVFWELCIAFLLSLVSMLCCSLGDEKATLVTRCCETQMDQQFWELTAGGEVRTSVGWVSVCHLWQPTTLHPNWVHFIGRRVKGLHQWGAGVWHSPAQSQHVSHQTSHPGVDQTPNLPFTCTSRSCAQAFGSLWSQKFWHLPSPSTGAPFGAPSQGSSSSVVMLSTGRGSGGCGERQALVLSTGQPAAPAAANTGSLSSRCPAEHKALLLLCLALAAAPEEPARVPLQAQGKGYR